MFRFQKREDSFEDLTPQEREEEIPNLANGLNFAKKVLATGECDVLILDEVLGLVEQGIATVEEIHALHGKCRGYGTDFYRNSIMSGNDGMGG